MNAGIVVKLSVAVLILGLVAVPLYVLAWIMPGEWRPDDVPDQRIESFPDGTIRYQELGSGPSLLLLHAFNGSLNQWDDVWNRLDTCPARRIRIDIPGYGQSEWRTQDFRLPAQADRIVALLDRLEIDDVTLVGTSMGASLSAWMAAEHGDRVRQVALFAPSGYPGSLTYPGLHGMLLRPGRLNRFAIRIARTRLYAALFPRSRALQSLTVANSYGQAWADVLANIEAPTLIAWSTGDPTAVFEPAAAEVHQRISGSLLLTLDDETRHSVPNTRPDLTAHLICRLAQGRSPSGAVTDLPPGLLRSGERASSEGES